MSIFTRIKDAIFGHRTAAPQTQTSAAPQPTGQTTTAPTGSQPQPSPQPVDVEEVLLQISRDKGNPDLNYKTSIVDLLKLLGIDSSLENRQELATELGYQGTKDGSAEMNMWLHKEVMRQLAAHGGKVPASLTD
jgi:Domain of unknown function (DUF3597)